MSIRQVVAGAACLALLTAVAPAMAQNPPAAAAAPAPSRATTFVVKFHVKAGRNADFEKVFLEMQKNVRAHEPGNVYYDFFVDEKDPQAYFIVERYKDAAAVAAHGSSEYGKKAIAALKDLLDAPVDAQRLVLLSAK